MSMKFIQKHYGVTLKRGDRVLYSGENEPREGVIVGASGAYLRVRLDGDRHVGLYHATWRLESLPSGR
jgi:hypothetical protein